MSQVTATREVRGIFRVCAGPRLGFGHLMRARALARALPWPAVFSVRGGAAARAAARRLGLVLFSPGDSIRHQDVVIVDDVNRQHARRWVHRAQRAGARTVAVFDRGGAVAADIAICGSIDAPGGDRQAKAALAGARFYLLDPGIAGSNRRLEVNRRTPRVLVALGGGAHVRRVARRVAGAVADRCPNAAIAVAAGFSTGRMPRLKGAQWLPATSSFLTALAGADAAIVAGGVTLYEAMALGIPAVGLAVVPEQRGAIRAFAAHRALIDARGTAASATAIDTAAAGIERLLAEPLLGRRMRDAARQLVDGRGVHRVAAAITSAVRSDAHA